jgi:hypothetical protein
MTVLAAASAAGADPVESPAMPRVRSSSPAIAGLIRKAVERSATFRALVDRINASDGIVYVEEGRCGHGVRACLVTVVTAGANRMLWVKVDTRKADWDLMGSIGHELRHTLEVLDEASVRSNVDMYFFDSRVGLRGTAGSAFETMAAVDAGDAVRAEIRKSARTAGAN